MEFTSRQVVRIVRRIIFAAFVVALLAPILPVSVVHAATTQYVLSTIDGPSTATVCTPLSGCSLRDALHAAAPGDTVALAPGIYQPFTVLLTAGPLNISQSVTIQGQGLLTVDGQNASRVFQVTAGTVEMDSVTITHGQASDQGAGIDVYSGALTLVNCVVTANTVSGTGDVFGGGILARSGQLTLTNTTVSDNSVMTTSTSTIFGVIQGQHVVLGGGIVQLGATLTIQHSSITGNSARLSGSGSGIPAQINGGGIAELQTITSVRDSTISANSVIGAPPDAVAKGAGIAVMGNYFASGPAGSTVTITNSTISGNRAPDGEGAGILAGASTNATLTVTSSTISGNQAVFGGGIGVDFAATTLTDTLVAGNSGSQNGPDVSGVVIGTSANNLIGNGTGVTGISNGSQGNQIGTAQSPIDPKLDPAGLQANGSAGPLTVALLRTSPAIEAGSFCPGGVTTDERGQPRVGACDIGAYEYQPVTPTVSNTTGPASGGSVTFHGTGFQTGTQLTIGNTTLTASGVSNDGTTFTVAVPAHSVGNVGVVVANPGSGHVAAGTLTYVPVVTSLSTTSGSATGGTPVTITGVGFVAGSTSVTFGNAATVTNVTATTITVTAPAYAAGTVDVTVTVNGVSGTKAGAYTYGTVNPIAPPQPTAGSPAPGTPISLPSPRPTGSPVSGSPNPLPPSR